jgi:hypothetical protein
VAELPRTAPPTVEELADAVLAVGIRQMHNKFVSWEECVICRAVAPESIGDLPLAKHREGCVYVRLVRARLECADDV